MVVTSEPCRLSTVVMQEHVAVPSIWTVQAPHSAWPQPNLVPVMPSTSRRTQRSGVSPSTSTLRCLPLISMVKAMAIPLRYSARLKGELDANAARLAHDEMDLRPLARQLWREFHDNARPAGDAFIQGIQSRSIGDGKG